jgi:hypothetical protein
MQRRRKSLVRNTLAVLAVMSLPVGLAALAAGSAAQASTATGTTAKTTNTSSLGSFSPTFAGPAATGCSSAECQLLSGPIRTASTANLSPAASAAARATSRSLPSRAAVATGTPGAHQIPYLLPQRPGPDPTPPTVSCQPMGPGCSPVSTSSGGAVGVKGLNAVDSGTLPTNPNGDIEPSDQGLCAGNGYVVEDNNIGEIMVFNPALHRRSGAISLDTIMGLTQQGWSSGGDIMCNYDYSNGGHWFFTEIVSESSEASGGAFAGCFAGTTPSDCLEGIAVTVGNNPFGPYNVYFVNANYNPNEPGYPYLFNDFAKQATTQDAFLLFYDEFPNNSGFPGIGGGFFNGAQELAFSKTAMELGEPVTLSNGKPNPFFNVAIENMGLLATPDGTCASDNQFNLPGLTCWYQVIPAQAPDPSQYDNAHGGTGFMVGSLDFYGQGDTRMAVFDWTGLSALNSFNCYACNSLRFGGELFSNGLYYFGEGQAGAQKAGPIPLGVDCGAIPGNSPTLANCPEGGIASNGDGTTQASQAQGQIWFAASTEVNQTFTSESSPETHLGAIYWVVNTEGLNAKGTGLTLTSSGYVSAAHENLEFPTMAAEGLPFQDGGNGGAIMSFTVNGTGGPTGADNGGFYPSSAYGRLTAFSGNLLGPIRIADLGQSPQDGFTEYLGLPGPTRPRWGDYGSAIFVPGTGGKIYFSSQYIQYPNCTGSAFTVTLATCGGTRDGLANWGTSMNYVTP